MPLHYLFQMGSGKLLAVWTAIFVNKNETKELWGECAEVLKQAGIDGLYSGVVHFRDRHTGCAVFEEALNIGFEEAGVLMWQLGIVQISLCMCNCSGHEAGRSPDQICGRQLPPVICPMP